MLHQTDACRNAKGSGLSLQSAKDVLNSEEQHDVSVVRGPDSLQASPTGRQGTPAAATPREKKKKRQKKGAGETAV